MKEIYKMVPDFPNYEVSNLGCVRKISGISIRISKTPSAHGYTYRCKLRSDDKVYNPSIGTLVAELFAPPPQGFKHFIYNDRNPGNACASNLQWVSDYDLAKHYFRGKQGGHVKTGTRESQIEKLERNLTVAHLFLDYLRKNDTRNISNIVLLFNKEIRDYIRRRTPDRERQEDCYQYTVCAFLEKINNNVMVSANIEAYLRGIIRNYFCNEWREKKKHKEVSYNDALI